MNDMDMTRFQETGTVPHVHLTLAQIVEGVTTLGIDLCDVVVIGSLYTTGTDDARSALQGETKS